MKISELNEIYGKIPELKCIKEKVVKNPLDPAHT